MTNGHFSMFQLTDPKRPTRYLATGGACLTLVVALSACGSSSSKSSGTPASAPATAASSSPAAAASSAAATTSSGGTAASGEKMIDIKNFAFSPMEVTVAVGTKVTWKFEDTAQHTVKADDGSFSSPPMSNGQTFSHTFTTAGTFKYICSIHPNMMASITVQ